MADEFPDLRYGYYPCKRVIRQGVEHKTESCTHDGACWRHVLGGVYCNWCWPCTDDMACLDRYDDPPVEDDEGCPFDVPVSGQSKSTLQ